MTINTRELIEAVSVITDNHNIRVTVKSSLKASAVVAGFTFVGAVVRINNVAKFCVCHKYFLLFLDDGPGRNSFGCDSGRAFLVPTVERFVSIISPQ